MEFSGRWEQANKVDNFISALESLNLKQDEIIAGKAVAEWLNWAKAWARQYNPLPNDIETMFESISKVESWTSS